jgi:hypothetical protein
VTTREFADFVLGIAPGTCENLVNTYNENASFQWIA